MILFTFRVIFDRAISEYDEDLVGLDLSLSPVTKSTHTTRCCMSTQTNKQKNTQSSTRLDYLLTDIKSGR